MKVTHTQEKKNPIKYLEKIYINVNGITFQLNFSYLSINIQCCDSVMKNLKQK